MVREDADPRLQGRARQCDATDDDPNCDFENPYLRFRIAPGIETDGGVVPTDDRH